jgi:hypothetical protein
MAGFHSSDDIVVDATVATKEEETHYYLSDTVRCCHLST